MKASELTAHLDREPEAEVRVSIAGEQPVRVRGVASVEGEIVLMAVPGWQFSDLAETMGELTRVVRLEDHPLRGWDDVFKVGMDADGGQDWVCRAHEVSRKTCTECKDKVLPGWHRGLKDPTRMACNCHCTFGCASAPKVERKVSA